MEESSALRPELLVDEVVKGGEYGVVETDGDMWRDHRRFALHVLRDLGLSKDGMEQRVRHQPLKLKQKKIIWLRFFLLSGILSYRDAFYAFFDRQIEAHRKDVDYESEHSNDYVEAFLKEQKRREADGDFETFK
ncbi:hypothetical protein TELCIR_04362 [Teladorsagia circumcincta]|uniref:Cytochrome P450 n=1 Tax=Teladorsagia circumcincta TaxID=45464 RepID=A0A2G9UTS4_TELCI|nr:hypothetical protein TELCIR_04362 [Teladorsagia circumcincta]